MPRTPRKHKYLLRAHAGSLGERLTRSNTAGDLLNTQKRLVTRSSLKRPASTQTEVVPANQRKVKQKAVVAAPETPPHDYEAGFLELLNERKVTRRQCKKYKETSKHLGSKNEALTEKLRVADEKMKQFTANLKNKSDEFEMLQAEYIDLKNRFQIVAEEPKTVCKYKKAQHKTSDILKIFGIRDFIDQRESEANCLLCFTTFPLEGIDEHIESEYHKILHKVTEQIDKTQNPFNI